MYPIVCDNCQSPNLITRSPVYDSELDRITSEEFECTDCHNKWLVEYKGGLAERDILLSKTTRPFFFVAQHQLESFIKRGYRVEEARAELAVRRTPRAPDAGDSAASTSIIHTSTESASEGNA